MIDGRLQACVTLPVDKKTWSGWCAVLTHPHPKLGGDLRNNVVQQVALSLHQIGVATICFNTRGVGRSTGSSTWRGISEREDVKAVIAFAKTLAGVSKVALVAYSFGAAVGLSVSEELVAARKLDAVIALGYPKGFFASFIFSSHYPLIDPQGGIPKLFVLGDSDDFTSVSTMNALFEGVSEPKELVIVPGADHFCFGQESLISQPVVDFFRKKLLQPAESNNLSQM
jgi:uncharacterized protein